MTITQHSHQPPRWLRSLSGIIRVGLATAASAVVIAFWMADWVRNQLFEERTWYRGVSMPRSQRAPAQSARDQSDFHEKH